MVTERILPNRSDNTDIFDQIDNSSKINVGIRSQITDYLIILRQRFIFVRLNIIYTNKSLRKSRVKLCYLLGRMKILKVLY